MNMEFLKKLVDLEICSGCALSRAGLVYAELTGKPCSWSIGCKLNNSKEREEAENIVREEFCNEQLMSLRRKGSK